MENSDVLGSSTVPLTWHDFLNRMRQPSAVDFVKAIKSFIVSLLNKPPDPERDSAAVQEFFSNMEAAFRSHPLWAGCSIEEMESAGEGLEKYVMTKLFTHVFASIPDDVKVDDQLHEKIALLQQFIWPDNLDIRPIYQNETSWLLAQKELQKINMYKAPRDKLSCILNCCKVINNLLLNASISSNENPPGADDFLPVLIYVTIKANPPQLHSNLSFIQRYRCQSRLVSEAAYFLTNMLSAETFILNSDAKALSMDEAEFEKNMESAKALLSDLLANSDDMPSQGDQNVGHVPRTESKDFKQQVLTSKHQSSTTRPRLTPNSSETNFGNEEIYMKDHLSMKQQLLNSKNQNLAMWPQLTPTSSETNIGNEEVYSRDQSSMKKVPSISDLENRGVTLLLKEDTVGQIFRDFPFLYSRAGDLTVKDVEDLLNSYKQLVFKYVCLSKGLGVATTSSKLSILQSETESQGEPKYCETEGLTVTHEDNVRTDDESNVTSPVGEEFSESELLQSQVVTSQRNALDEISQT